MTLHCGDARTVLAGLPAQSVHATICSPPYLGLRAYNGGRQEIGLEQTPQEYVAALVEVFRALWLVLRDDGTLWVVLGDSYAAAGGHTRPGRSAQVGKTRRNVMGAGSTQVPAGYRAKALLGIPWRVAFALQDDGWLLRQEVIWHKPNPMPESVKDRCTRGHETVFMLAKGPRYYYDADAIRDPLAVPVEQCAKREGRNAGNKQHYDAVYGFKHKPSGNMKPGAVMWPNRAGRNKRSVWTVATAPLSSKKYGCDTEHYAAFPPELVRPMVLAATSERGVCPQCGAPWRRVVERGRIVCTGGSANGKRASNMAAVSPRGQAVEHAYNTGRFVQREHLTTGWQPTCACDAGSQEPVPATVLDCFCGSGTTGVVAVQEGRRFVGVDLKEAYLRLAAARIATVQPALLSAAAV